MKVELQFFKDVFDEELAKDAIINDRMEGFREDYLVLHCLLRKYKPKTFMEIGTHTGFGTKIIINALGKDAVVCSIDLKDDEADLSKQHPLSEGKRGVGFECDLPYRQIKWNTLTYDFSSYRCKGYYVDGEHTWANVFVETSKIIEQHPYIIIWHDTDIPEVYKAIMDAFRKNEDYNLYRVVDTRMAYAIRRDFWITHKEIIYV